MSDRSYPASIIPSARWPLLACAAWFALLAGVAVLLGPGSAGLFVPIAVASAIATTVFLFRLARNREGTLVVTSDRIVLGPRSVSRAGLRVDVAIWKMPSLWTVRGAALELAAPDGELIVGALDHLPARRPSRAVYRADASLMPEDFVDLARCLGGEDLVSPRRADEALEVELVPSRTGARFVIRTMAPWLLTMVLAGSLGVVGSLLGLEDSSAGRLGMTIGTILVVVAGLAVTIVKSSRPPVVGLRLVVRHESVELIDVRETNRGRVPLGRPSRATPLVYRLSTRGGSYDFPVVCLEWPSGDPLVIGVWDYTVKWGSPVARAKRLDYLVGAEEWRAVTRALRLGTGTSVS